MAGQCFSRRWLFCGYRALERGRINIADLMMIAGRALHVLF